MDLTKLSDQELEAMLARGQKKPAVDLSKASNEELQEMLIAKPAESMEYDNPLAAAALGAGQQFSFGYLPELKGAADVAIEKAKNLAGDTKPDISYKEAKDKFRQEIEKYKKYNPKSFTAGEVAGVIASVPVAGGLIGKAVPALAKPAAGLLGRALQGAGSGAIQSAAYNPGEREQGEDALQLSKRLQSAKTGALFGAGGQLAGEAVGKGLSKLKEVPTQLEKMALTKAFKSSGAMLKDFRKASNRGKVADIGKTMMEEGLVKPGTTFEDVFEKSATRLEDVGEKIGKVYDKIGKSPLNPTELGNDLTQAVMKDIPKLGREQYSEKMKNVIEEIVLDADVVGGDVRAINQVISNLDDKINWGKANAELPEIQKGYKALRNSLRQKLNNIAESSGSRDLKELNKKYSNLIEIRNISKDRVLREEANQMFGLSDKILGGVGAATAFGATQDEGAEGLLKSGLIGLGAAAASKGGRLYGAPLMTRGLLAGSKAASKVGGLIPDAVSKQAAGLLSDPRFQALSRMEAEKQNK